MSKVFQIGIIGMGGYAKHHHDAIHRLEEQGLARLVCTCDPNFESFADQQKTWKFSRRKIKPFRDYREMLVAHASQLDIVVVPTPLYLHMEMHRACLEAGVACYLEKPPTLDYAELETMIDVERAAKKKTFVGFNYISEPTRLHLKQRLLSGDFGKVKQASLKALWRRPVSYFQRNHWSGRLQHEGRLVLDSCFGNAMAHFVHNMLFWVGQDDLYSWGAVAEVRAELYRANAIEGADTFFVEAVAGGIPIRFALTHACGVKEQHVEVIVCEHATIHFAVGSDIEIHWRDGHREIISPPSFAVPYENHLDYFRYLRGESSRPSTTLEDCQPFVYLNDLALISSETIETVASHRLVMKPHDEPGDDCVAIQGIEEDFKRFIEDGTWPRTNGWGRSLEPQTVMPADLSRLHKVVDAMLELGKPDLIGNAVSV